MYKIQEVANLAGVSKRTLQHYDTIGLLSPHKDPKTSYRWYNDDDLDRLQQILFYKELDYSLKDIKDILNSNITQIIPALKKQERELKNKIEHLNKVHSLIKTTIRAKERNIRVENQEKFEVFKDKQIQDNDNKYGQELRTRYGNDIIDQSNQHFKNKSKYEIKQQEQLNMDLNNAIKEATKDHNIHSKKAKLMCELHTKWIQFYWPTYDKAQHLALCKMYTEDDRFKAYYDKISVGSAEFLYEAMKEYLKK
jgi:DNA-binding transcriptional MerR regulator